jgi:hypothetical protein
MVDGCHWPVSVTLLISAVRVALSDSRARSDFDCFISQEGGRAFEFCCRSLVAMFFACTLLSSATALADGP